jgi:hypothetical protein
VLTLVSYDAAGALAGRRASRVAATVAAGLTVGQPVPDEVVGIYTTQPAVAAEPLPEPEPHAVSMTVTGRAPPLPRPHVLPAADRHPPHRLAAALVDRRVARVDPGLAVRARDRPRAVAVPPVPLALHPVRDAPDRVPVHGRQPLPRVRRQAGHRTRSTSSFRLPSSRSASSSSSASGSRSRRS